MTIFEGIRQRPVTALMLCALSIYAFWIGYIIDSQAQYYRGPVRRSFDGPESIMPLHAWAYTYLILGFVCLARLALLKHRHWIPNYLLHMATVAPLVAWAIGFDLYLPPILGQPSYTLVAFLAIVLPFITAVVDTGWIAGRHRRHRTATRRDLALHG